MHTLSNSKAIKLARVSSPLLLLLALAACNGSTNIDPNSLEESLTSPSIENGKLAVSSTHPNFKAEVSNDGVVSLAWPAVDEANSYNILRNGGLIASSNEPFYVDTSARRVIAAKTRRAVTAPPTLRYSVVSVEDSGSRPIAENLNIDLDLNPLLLAALQNSEVITPETELIPTQENEQTTEPATTPTSAATVESLTMAPAVAEANVASNGLLKPTATSLTMPTVLYPTAGSKIEAGEAIVFQWGIPTRDVSLVNGFDFYVYDQTTESVIFRNQELSTSVCSDEGVCSYSPKHLSLPAAVNHVWRVAAYTGTQYTEFSYVRFDILDTFDATVTASAESLPVVAAALEANPIVEQSTVIDEAAETSVTIETPTVDIEPNVELNVVAAQAISTAAPTVSGTSPISAPNMLNATYPPDGKVIPVSDVIEYIWSAAPSTLSAIDGFDFYLYNRITESVIFRDNTLTTDLCDSAGVCRLQPSTTFPAGDNHVWRVAAFNVAGYSEFTYTTIDIEGPVTEEPAASTIAATEETAPEPQTEEAPVVQTTTAPQTTGTVGPTQTSAGDFNQNAIYVAADGNNNNSGLSEAAAYKSIQVGINAAKPGDTVYVKAGNYGAVNLSISKSGTTGSPITIEGYQSTPGDNPSIANFNHNSSLNASIMPLLDGGSRASNEVGISVTGHHIVLKNIQITRYRSGLYTSDADYGVFENIIVVDMGNPAENYDGMGIFISGATDNSVIRNCVVVNAGAQGFTLRGSYNLFENNAVYADDDSTGHDSAMDYYFILNDSYYNTISNNYMERVGDLDHVGHGFTVKGNNEHNVFDGNTAVNMKGGAFVARWSGATNNTFSNNTVIGGDGILARDGAHHNTFENIHISGSRYGIYAMNAQEDTSNTSNASSENNTFRNITIKNVKSAAIFYSSYVSSSTLASGNVYENLAIDGAPLLFRADHNTSGNVLKNSTVTNVDEYYYSSVSSSTSYLGITIENTTLTNNGFTLP